MSEGGVALRLTVRCGPNPRLQPLMDGSVRPEGIDLQFAVEPVEVLFYKNLHADDFELSEMSISETLLARDRRERWGAGRWNWTALPIFLSRGHAWLRLQVHRRSGIQTLADLRGKRVAVPDYDMTAAVWLRATLKDLYGIEAADIAWYNVRTRGASHGIELGLDQDPPPGVRLVWLAESDDAAGMLDRGELDAGFSLYPAGRTPGADVVPLLGDGGRQVIAEYFQRTGAFQPNHHYVVQDRVVRQHPWAAMALYAAFERSKQMAYARLGRGSDAYLYFGGDPAEQAAIYGEDPYPCGLGLMRPTLERLERASFEQGLIRRRIPVDSLYHPSTLAT